MHDIFMNEQIKNPSAVALGSLGGNRNTEAQRKARAANVAAINARRVAKAAKKRIRQME